MLINRLGLKGLKLSMQDYSNNLFDNWFQSLLLSLGKFKCIKLFFLHQ